MDFLVDVGGRVELFEAKWTELPAERDAVNLAFVTEAVGRARVARSSVVCRAKHGFPLSQGTRVLTVEELA